MSIIFSAISSFWPTKPAEPKDTDDEKSPKKDKEAPAVVVDADWSKQIQKMQRRLDNPSRISLFDQMRLFNEEHPHFKKANAIYGKTIGSEIPEEGPEVSDNENKIVTEESLADKISDFSLELHTAGSENIEAHKDAYVGKLRYLIELSKRLSPSSELFLRSRFEEIREEYGLKSS